MAEPDKEMDAIDHVFYMLACYVCLDEASTTRAYEAMLLKRHIRLGMLAVLQNPEGNLDEGARTVVDKVLSLLPESTTREVTDAAREMGMLQGNGDD